VEDYGTEQRRLEMENTFDSTYIINKAKYDEFVNDASRLAVAVYTIPAFIWLELYKCIDIHKDIAMRVVWKPETTVGQIKDFDKTWFLKKYE
jgi:hypothetical protein